MPQSLVKSYHHLIFSTKNREHLICVDDYPEIKAYIVDVLSKMGCYLVEIGGTANHVHILFTLGKTVSISDVVAKVKSNSSRWLHKRYSRFFAWQEGYAAFSVSATKLDVVTRYIQNQEEHHRKVGFEEEYREFLKAYGIEWDERYAWD